jgi:hypothetical protein
MNPRFPIYIPSKGRWESRLTARYLDAMGVPYRMVIEVQERDAYAAVIDPAKLLILDPSYQRDYNACMSLADDQSKGSGPARNFIWDHARASGAEQHWVIDDNIRGFQRLKGRSRIDVTDGTIFRCMEDFTLRYKNVAQAGPHYKSFATTCLTRSLPPFLLNTRIFSCILIRNDLPFRWRARYNEDADLSLRLLKAGYCTLLFYAFLQNKMTTQSMKGGNTDELYRNGTLAKSRMLQRLHPDVTKVVWRYNRWHHHVDYRPFKRNKLIRRTDIEIPRGIDNYGMRLVQLPGAMHEPTRTSEARADA